MPALIVTAIIISLICFVLAFIFDKIEDLFYLLLPFFVFIGNKIFLVLALFFFGAAAFVYLYFKPHPAEKYIKKYQEGKISRGVAVEKIVGTLYSHNDYLQDRIPSVYQSRIVERRLNALKKRVKVENEFMEEIIRYMKIKSRFDSIRR